MPARGHAIDGETGGPFTATAFADYWPDDGDPAREAARLAWQAAIAAARVYLDPHVERCAPAGCSMPALLDTLQRSHLD